MPISTIVTNSLADSAVTTDKVANTAITTPKITDGAVTNVKHGPGSVIQVQTLSSTTKATTGGGNTFVEVSSSYRVGITPLYSNSLIVLHYHLPLSWGTSWFVNSVASVRAMRFVSGSPTQITSNGSSNGSRLIGGFNFRSSNGFDLNDANNLSFTVIDSPSTTSAIEYGFQTRNEGGTMYFGYSNSDNGSWGFTSNVLITAMEIRQ